MAIPDLEDGVFANEEYWYDLDYMAENIVNNGIYEEDNPSFEQILDCLPSEAKIARRVYFPEPDLDWVVGRIADRPFGLDAEAVWEHVFIDYTYWIDFDFEQTPEGLADLQSAIDVFRCRNQFLWAIIDRFPWFDPMKHSWGKQALSRGLRELALANRHFWLLEESGEKVALDRDFWEPYIIDYLENL